MVGKTKDFAQPLYLRRYGVPFDALTYVFGKNDMYWYRAFLALGRCLLVGTTIKQGTMMPQHLLADEKHSRWKGQKVYLPTVAANGCLFGIEISARLFLRAIALIWNFHPLCGRTSSQSKSHECNFPFERINHYCYSHNWLENLLIAGSMNGYRSAT